MPDQEKMKILTKKSETLKVIAHPIRLCILNCLMEMEECNVTTLAKRMETPQSTVSQHLSKLKSHSIIEGRRNGVEIQYRMIDDNVRAIVSLLLNQLYEGSDKEKTIKC